MSRMALAVTPEHFWGMFAELLRADLLALGEDWGKTYQPSRPWTKHMVTSPDALLTRVGTALGYVVRREVDRIDVCYYGADDVRYVAIEHEGGQYHFPEGKRQKGWKHEFTVLTGLKSELLRVLIIYDQGRATEVEDKLAVAVRECCPPEVNSNSLLVIIGPWYDSYRKEIGLADYVAYKFLDGKFVALPRLPILPGVL